MKRMQSVIRFEPDSALFAEKQGLAIYQNIAEAAHQFLNPQGKIYLEIGYKQGPAVKDLFEKAFPTKKVRVHRDIFEKDRMISVT